MHSEMRGIALLLLVLFAGELHAVKADAKSPASAEQSQRSLAAQPQNQAKLAGTKPAASPATRQEVAPNKAAPANDGDSGATLANLPAAKRLAISMGAGLFTLVLALWIGARRD